jgi:4,5-dihydroxyphthalate decarboxylase
LILPAARPRPRLGAEVVDGEISSNPSQAGRFEIGLLFPNYREVEIEYYKHSGMFPIMHLIGIRKDLVERHQWLPATIYKAFCQAKKIAIDELKEMAATKVTLPWPEMYVQDAARLMGEDFWRYGVAENARDIETLARYSFEQGLATRKLSAQEIFHPSVLEISKV